MRHHRFYGTLDITFTTQAVKPIWQRTIVLFHILSYCIGFSKGTARCMRFSKNHGFKTPKGFLAISEKKTLFFGLKNWVAASKISGYFVCELHFLAHKKIWIYHIRKEIVIGNSKWRHFRLLWCGISVICVIQEHSIFNKIKSENIAHAMSVTRLWDTVLLAPQAYIIDEILWYNIFGISIKFYYFCKHTNFCASIQLLQPTNTLFCSVKTLRSHWWPINQKES